MVFNSATFILFFAAVVAVNFLLPARLRRYFLLLASYAYYCFASPAYCLLLAATTLFGWRAGIRIGEAEEKARGRRTAFAVIALFAVLALFKYTGVWRTAAVSVAGLLGGALDAAKLAAPLGISFYTFSLVGYLVDVKRGKLPPERDLLSFAFYVSFFPQLLCGPIARAGELLPQFREPKEFDYGRFVAGLQRFVAGAFRKVVLADGLALLVNGVYADLPAYDSLALWFVYAAYPLVIYNDFCGYSDMAIGAAQMLGYTLRENFHAPFLQTDMGSYWKGWHMSLTTWFNDYLFLPLVWSRWWDKLFHKKELDTRAPSVAADLFLVFLLSGLWHGAAATYLIWGAGHGAVRLLEEALPKRKKKDMGKAERALRRAGVFTVDAVTHVFFRSESLAQAAAFFAGLFRSFSPAAAAAQLTALAENGIASSWSYRIFFFGSLLFAFFVCLRLDRVIAGLTPLTGKRGAENPLAVLPRRERWFLYRAMGVLTLLFYFLSMSGNATVSFIYFGY